MIRILIEPHYEFKKKKILIDTIEMVLVYMSKQQFKTNFISCLSRGGQKSDSDLFYIALLCLPTVQKSLSKS